ncbi:hypothetical protein [Shimia abyssi]|uniref:Uncharacterized protein n=1 Tax=Shimia abyssi TaxID=1662395 RepID=A0A2P8FJD2_9RHOB|nr:hypothetical protein [Shimia abyssi]PSL21815.1 hypothetical protein CLV88_101239 [Shimia abyssi]
MLGVVLWSDAKDNKAVIWCEDHGDLAFFSGETEQPDMLLEFDAGDLVQFDVQQERHQRYARNPRRLGQGTYAGLPDTLNEQSQKSAKPHRPIEVPVQQEPIGTSNVVCFSAASAVHRDRIVEIA